MDILEEVKKRLGVTGTYHDETLNGFITDTKAYLTSAGVSDVESDDCIGVIARGAADLWNMGSGEGKFSSLFYERAIQLSIGE